MNVVFYTAYAIEVAIFIFQNTPDEFEQLGSVVFVENWLPVFGAVNNLEEQLSKGTHVGFFEWLYEDELSDFNQ